jgi:hypothetical protein
MQSIERYVDFEATSLIDYYFLPYLHNSQFNESFITEQALMSKRMTKSDSKMLAGMYLADKAMASVWHHSLLMESCSQTIYGFASRKDNDDYILNWESKGP